MFKPHHKNKVCPALYKKFIYIILSLPKIKWTNWKLKYS